ncbi:MAG: type II toxin-antitoxin system RelE/ParE family toxin [Planctomycetota bacterium]|jgi:proteic killer suppression protein|nr:type II toxin-antitoxin system RelE/ParE family toxin [Planctomycetota bacterium]
MIQSFGDKRTRAIYDGDTPRGFPPEFIRNAVIRLEQLNYVNRVESLQIPPSNRLEKLRGKGKAFWSIRINDQWRIIFKWTDTGPAAVQIIDYH